MTLSALIMTINVLVNSSVAYMPEPEGSDVWQSLETTAQLKTGDCEDYAIAKRELLIRNGVDASKLRLVVTAHQGAAHMVLGYFETDDSAPLILDNVTNEIKAREELKEAVGLQPDGTWMGGIKYAGVSSKFQTIK